MLSARGTSTAQRDIRYWRRGVVSREARLPAAARLRPVAVHTTICEVLPVSRRRARENAETRKGFHVVMQSPVFEPTAATPAPPIRLSVVMPMYNAAATIGRCLVPLLRMREAGEVHEIIVVDDASTDGSTDRICALPVRLLRNAVQGGPGAARNLAAPAATGTHLWFVDSDVVVADDAARVILSEFRREPVAALMGSYDDAPDATNFLSQYKNLIHRYYHQRGRKEASTFWAGCGVVDREVFLRLGGFDAARYRYPSIEDIELGYRIRDAGERVRLVHDLQGKHLKEWRLRNLLHTEIFRRALPWTRLMLRRGGITDDLNVGRGERARAALAGVFALLLAATALGFVPVWAAASAGAGAAVANLSLLRFFLRHRGLWFAAGAAAFHQVYYLYASASFAWAAVEYRLSPGRRG